MADSLLAHLYSRIKGSQEDVATMSLQYIISSSDNLKAAYNKLMSDSLKINIAPDINYTCQSVGEKNERPDMSGVDKDGNEVILCEMKFYAGLTFNQPNGYLDRLQENGGKALVFVCPNARRVTLWSKLKELCIDNGRILEDEDGYRITVDGIAMSVVTWTEIINELRRVASSTSVESLPDIVQLEGFCNLMDQNAFIPFSSEELGPETPRKEDRYYQVVDAVINLLYSKKDLSPSTKGVKASPSWFGYNRAIMIKNVWCVISYDRSVWERSPSESPFWLFLRDAAWKQPKEYSDYFKSIPDNQKDNTYGYVALSLHPLTDVPLDDIADDMASRILKHIEELELCLDKAHSEQ